MRMADSTAVPFTTGSEPGSARHTGHTCVLGAAPNVVEHPQNILSRCSVPRALPAPGRGRVR